MEEAKGVIVVQDKFFSLNRMPEHNESVLLDLANKAMLSAAPEKLIQKQLSCREGKLVVQGKEFDISKGKLFVIGLGKASVSMAKGVEAVVGPENIEDGIVVSNTDAELSKVRVIKSTHPFPSDLSVKAAEAVLELASKCSEDDIVLCLISGGGSALLELPEEGITVDDQIEATKTLIFHGILAEDIAIVRRHTSKIKGGRLAKEISPARIINLVISDSIYEPFNVSAGPTLPDKRTFQDAMDLIKKFDIEEKLPKSVFEHIKGNIGNEEKETVKEDDPIFKKVDTFLVYNNEKFVENLKKVAEEQGIFDSVVTYPKTLDGTADSGSEKLAEFIDENDGKNVLLVAGGELEVKKKKGKGGRCQHIAALMIPKIKNIKDSLFMSFGTDGRDFIEGIAGAVVSDNAFKEASDEGIDCQKLIDETDSYSIHDKLKSHLLSSNTGNNVLDVYIFARFNRNQ